MNFPLDGRFYTRSRFKLHDWLKADYTLYDTSLGKSPDLSHKDTAAQEMMNKRRLPKKKRKKILTKKDMHACGQHWLFVLRRNILYSVPLVPVVFLSQVLFSNTICSCPITLCPALCLAVVVGSGFQYLAWRNVVWGGDVSWSFRVMCVKSLNAVTADQRRSGGCETRLQNVCVKSDYKSWSF